MALTLVKTKCCAVAEVNDLGHVGKASDAVLEIAKLTSKWKAARYLDGVEIKAPPPPIIIFTGVTMRDHGDHSSNRQDDYGQALADYIVKNKLGTIVKTKEVINPLTRNGVTLWAWNPDYEALNKLEE